jgi:hypothetical protein
MWKLEDKARESLNANKIDYLKNQDNDAFRNETMDAVWAEIPILKYLKSCSDFITNFNANHLAINIWTFLKSLTENEFSTEGLQQAYEDIRSVNNEDVYSTLLTCLDKLDNLNKASIMANLLAACARKELSASSFLRLTTSLIQVPYVDLMRLDAYVVDCYEDGSTEMLASSGLVRETVINEQNADILGESYYGLTKNGEDMLCFGLKAQRYIYSGEGRHISGLDWYKGD